MNNQLVLDPAKIAAAQAQADRIRTDLAQPIVLDYAKIAALQQWGVELRAKFPHCKEVVCTK